jgi:integrase
MNDDVHAALLEARELAQTDHVVEFNGSPLKSVEIAFRRLCKACDIKASLHVLRQTAATWLVMDGVPLREAVRLLGNSEAMVEKVYGKHLRDYLRRAVNSLRLVSKKSTSLEP